MQNFPLEATQITSVIVLNAWNCKFYGALPNTLPGRRPPGPPAAKALIHRMSAFVTKLNLYPKNGYFWKCLDKSLLRQSKLVKIIH